MRTYKAWLFKAYFDEGWNIINYAKYFILVLGLKLSPFWMTILWFDYACFSFILGYFIYETKIIEEKNEVNNNYNPFQKEVRKHIRKGKI